MRDVFYGDDRDLVKWSVLLHLARDFIARQILQIAFYREGEFGSVLIDRRERPVPVEVKAHFRSVDDIARIRTHDHVAVSVFKRSFDAGTRDGYITDACQWIGTFTERCLVFLDPDTGLEPESNPGWEHVLEAEVRRIWESLKQGNVLVFYQHKTNRAGRPWKEPKRRQLERALRLRDGFLKIAEGAHRKKGTKADGIARDVVFYFAQKPNRAR